MWRHEQVNMEKRKAGNNNVIPRLFHFWLLALNFKTAGRRWFHPAGMRIQVRIAG